jgi:uncharacterized repeat protein (TIGR01451 family)
VALRRYVLTAASAVCFAAIFAGAPAAKRTTTPAIQPVITCIMEQPDRTYDVQFGYVNSTGARQTIPLGAANHFAPANTFNHRNPTVDFAPGSVPHAVFVSNIPNSVHFAWTISYGGQTATVVADHNVPPHCPKPNGPAATPPPAKATLAVSAWSTVRKAHVGRVFVFGVRIVNTSGVTASAVTLTDVVSPKVALIGLQPQSSGCTQAARTTSCTIASIPPHRNLRFGFTVRAAAKGNALNLVKVTLPQAPALTARAAVHIVPARRH